MQVSIENEQAVAPPMQDFGREMATPVLENHKGGGSGAVLVGFALLAAACVVLGVSVGSTQLQLLDGVVVLGLFAVSVNLLVGVAGILSFGQAVFYALGAYTISLGWLHYQLPFSVRVLLAVAIGAVAALVIGAVALRTQRWFFALVTLGFSQLFYTIVEEAFSYTNGETGVFGAMVPGWLARPLTGYLFIVGVTMVCLVVLWLMAQSPFGLVLRAARDDRERARALGINVYLHQLCAFVIAGAFAALAGCLFVVANQATYPTMFDWLQSGDPVLAAVIGGTGSFAGPLIGAIVLQYGKEMVLRVSSHWELVLGLVLLAVVLLRPAGLAGIFEALGDRARRALAGMKEGR